MFMKNSHLIAWLCLLNKIHIIGSFSLKLVEIVNTMITESILNLTGFVNKYLTETRATAHFNRNKGHRPF